MSSAYAIYYSHPSFGFFLQWAKCRGVVFTQDIRDKINQYFQGEVEKGNLGEWDARYFAKQLDRFPVHLPYAEYSQKRLDDDYSFFSDLAEQIASTGLINTPPPYFSVGPEMPWDQLAVLGLFGNEQVDASIEDVAVEIV